MPVIHVDFRQRAADRAINAEFEDQERQRRMDEIADRIFADLDDERWPYVAIDYGEPE